MIFNFPHHTNKTPTSTPHIPTQKGGAGRDIITAVPAIRIYTAPHDLPTPASASVHPISRRCDQNLPKIDLRWQWNLHGVHPQGRPETSSPLNAAGGQTTHRSKSAPIPAAPAPNRGAGGAWGADWPEIWRDRRGQAAARWEERGRGEGDI